MKTKEIHTFRKTYKKYDKPCHFEGYKLAVLFDEKDDVKSMGGRWDAGAEHWWMPADKLTNQIHDNGTLVRDALNDSMMIMGQFGQFRDTTDTRTLLRHDDHFTEYGIHKSNNEPQFKVQFFYDMDVVKFIPTGMGELATEYLNLEDGRKRWDVLIGIGYNRVENS
jgi:hypothetical protein